MATPAQQTGDVPKPISISIEEDMDYTNTLEGKNTNSSNVVEGRMNTTMREKNSMNCINTVRNGMNTAGNSVNPTRDMSSEISMNNLSPNEVGMNDGMANCSRMNTAIDGPTGFTGQMCINTVNNIQDSNSINNEIMSAQSNNPNTMTGSIGINSTSSTNSMTPLNSTSTANSNMYESKSSAMYESKNSSMYGSMSGYQMLGIGTRLDTGPRRRERFRMKHERPGDCAVCGEPANGMYFGAMVCLPCKVRNSVVLLAGVSPVPLYIVSKLSLWRNLKYKKKSLWRNQEL